MVSITNAEVQEVYGEKDPNLDSAKKTAQRQIAERFTDQVKSGRIARLKEIEGDEADFTKYVAAALWDISTGRSLNQEFQTGNAEPSQALLSNPRDFLAANTYGAVALMIAGGERGSISVVRTDR